MGQVLVPHPAETQLPPRSDPGKCAIGLQTGNSMRRILLAGLVLAFSGPAAWSQALDCDGWTTAEFFEVATFADVGRCLSLGRKTEERSDYGETPLHLAAGHSGNPEIVKVFLDIGASVNTPDGEGLTPLYYAARNQNPAVAAILLERGADLDAPFANMAALHLAAYDGNLAVAALMLEGGADPNAPDIEGGTPLHLAAGYGGNPELVTLLLDRGADLHAVEGSNGWTPLHSAAAFGGPGIAGLLLERGADIDARDMIGQTPLHTAAAFGSDPATVALLLDRGANPKARDINGSAPWDLMQKNDPLIGTKVYWRLNDLRFN